MQDRYYQNDAVVAIDAGWQTFEKQLLVLPTGTGKTNVFSQVVKNHLAQSKRCLILAHRNELIEQAAKRLKQSFGVSTVLEKADARAYELQGTAYAPPAVLGSVQTLNLPRLAKWDKDYFDLLVIDEAHHCLSESYTNIINHFNARVLGVTATPDRGDKRQLADVFENIAYEYSMRDAIKDGYLCPIKAKLLPVEISLETVRKTAGDYNAADIDAAIDPLLQAMAAQIATNIGERKTIIFCPLIDTSQKMAWLLRELGVNAVHIDGTSKDRETILTDYEADKYQVLCNSSLLLEGYDCPAISCVIVLRPTQVRSLYCQMVGRGTRIHPGKNDLLILDFLWLATKHDLCKPASLFAHDANEARQMSKKLSTDYECDILEVQKELIHERENALVQKLKENANKETMVFDPLLAYISFDGEDREYIGDYEPTTHWEAEPPTQAQLDTLAKAGFKTQLIKYKGQASTILDRLSKRRDMGLCTPKQMAILNRFGIKLDKYTSCEAASAQIGALKANNWKPYNNKWRKKGS